MKLEIYGKPNCKYCVSAKELCRELGLKFTYIDIDADAEAKRDFMLRTNFAKTVPQIFLNDSLIGGFDEFKQVVANGHLGE